MAVVIDDGVHSFAGRTGRREMPFATCLGAVDDSPELALELVRIAGHCLHKSPVALVHVLDLGQPLPTDHDEAMDMPSVRTQDDEEALDIFDACGRLLFHARPVDEVDVATFQYLRHRCILCGFTATPIPGFDAE